MTPDGIRREFYVAKTEHGQYGTAKEQDMERDFRVGDKVTCILLGPGEVDEVCSSSKLPVVIRFYSGRVSQYTQDGRHQSHFCRTLYHGHNITFEVTGEEVPKRTVKRYVNLNPSHADNSVQGDPGHWEQYETKEKAKAFADPDAVAVAVPVEIPEGEV